jgi:hypothetical protein
MEVQAWGCCQVGNDVKSAKSNDYAFDDKATSYMS